MFYTQQQIVAIIHRHPHRVLLQRWPAGAEAATRLVKMHFVTLKPKMMMGFKRDSSSLKISTFNYYLAATDREVEIHEQQQRKCISYYRPHENAR